MPFSFIGLPGEMNAFLAIPVPLNKVSRVVMKSQNNNAKSGLLMHSLSRPGLRSQWDTFEKSERNRD